MDMQKFPPTNEFVPQGILKTQQALIWKTAMSVIISIFYVVHFNDRILTK